jgi:tagatose-1,6-bisphosphate aldolase non-catalytic subunit AgaZ/GatZ
VIVKRNSQTKVEMQKRNLVDAIQERAINYGDDNVRIYANYSAEELNKWVQQNRSLVFYDASDSILSLDIINHLVKAARDFAQLINLQHT